MKYRIHILTFILCLCITACSVTACSQDGKHTVSEIADTLKSFSSSEIDWKQLGGDQLSSYFGFEADITKAYTAYINGAENHFDIIIAAQPVDPEARADIIKGLTFAMTTASSNFKSANETEYKKITSGRIVETDDILILVIMDNYDKINGYFEELGAKTPKVK